MSKDLDQLNNVLYSGLEPQRLRHHDELIAALQEVAFEPSDFDGWVRIVPWQFTNEPLSAAGSLKDYGGRFNIGQDVNHSAHGHWPALYIAEDQETAYRERFGLAKNETIDGLSAEELGLSNASSYSAVRMRGRIELVFDLGQRGALKPFCAILGKMKLPVEAKHLGKRLKLKRVRLIRCESQLRQEALEFNWRALPVQFGTPAVSQLLASFIIQAGYEAIRYPSTKGNGQCIAVFPHRLANENSWVEVCDARPAGLPCPRLDMDSAQRLCGWDVLRPELRPPPG